MWVSSSHRPLNSLELRNALATRLDDDDLDVDNIPPLRLIVRSCCGLVAVDDLDNDCSEVRLVHHTLYQYLHSRERAWLADVHPMIVQTCLAYLLFKSSVSTATNPIFALKSFARNHWGYHAALSPLDTYIQPALRLFDSRLEGLYPENDRITGLHIAAAFGLTQLVDSLLSRGHRIDATDNRFETPLYKACVSNNTETAIFLLDRGAYPDTWSLSGVTVLFVAVEIGNERLIRAILDYGGTIDMFCKDHWTPLHKAADAGNLEIVKYLISRGASTGKTSARGLTALHRAAGRGHLDVLRFLLNAKMQIDCVTRDGWTALHGAASSGRTEAVSLLLDYGADMHGCCQDGQTPLHRAVLGGHPHTVEMLISRGADVMKQDDNGDLPLHLAAREGHGEIIVWLLEKDSQQLSYINEEGWSPLHEAQLSGFHTAEKLLRQAHSLSTGEITDDDILTKAIQTDDVDMIQQFLDTASIEIESHDTQGRTLLHQAFHAESYNVASALLDRGADIHAQFETGGWQPIHYAALSGKTRAVHLCLHHGADPNARTQDMQTPLHHACRNGNEETVQFLLDHNVDVMATDERDWRPLHNAAAAGHRGIVNMLVFSGRMEDAVLDGSWSGLQSCAAKRGHHELVEMIREFRYSF